MSAMEPVSIGARGIAARALALAALSVSVALAGCGDAGGGSGASGSAASGVGAGMPGSLRLVGFDRRALSPGAASRMTLVVERPAGAPTSHFALEESLDGVSYFASGLSPRAALASALLYEAPFPASPRWYRIASPAPSNAVLVDPAAAQLSRGGALAPDLASPAAGALFLSKVPTVAVAGGAGAQSFLFAIADEEGALVWLAESASPRLAPGDAGARTFIATGGLAGASMHLATAVALDAQAFGAASGAAPRAEFTTAP